MKRVCVNRGSNPGFDPCYMAAAEHLGCALVNRGLDLVYGGANVGLMGRVADTVLDGGRTVIGVIPKAFAARVSHDRLTELHVVGTMHERKAMMFELSDAFIALPGGFGTLDEMFEILSWGQLGFHRKPYGLVNVDGYFDPLLEFLDKAVSKGFVKPRHREMLLVSDDPEELLAAFESYTAPTDEKWLQVSKDDVSTPDQNTIPS